MHQELSTWEEDLELELELERLEREANSPPLNTFGEGETPDDWVE